MALFSAISLEYFRVMDIPLLRGRFPTEQDTESAPWVVVINDAMARKYACVLPRKIVVPGSCCAGSNCEMTWW